MSRTSHAPKGTTAYGKKLISLGVQRALLAAVSICALTNSARADLLINGDFNLDADASGGPDGWVNWGYGPTSFSAYKADPANDSFDFDGTPYVNAGNYGDWWSSGGGWYQEVPFAGADGTPFSFKAFGATEDWDNAAGELRIIYLGEANAELQRDVRHSASYQANKPWTLVELTSVAPAGTLTVKVEFATWGARGAVLWDQGSLTTASVWNVDDAGDAAEPANWVGGAPGGVDAAARFLGKITSNRTVAVDAPLTLGSISFANTNSYVLAGSSTLRLETSSGSAFVDVQTGTHRINLPLTIASDAYLSVADGATLEIGDPLTIAAGKSVKPSGTGTITYQSSVTLETDASIVFAADTRITSLTLGPGSSAVMAAHLTAPARTLAVESLAAAPGSSINLSDNSMLVDYTGTSPINDLINAFLGGSILANGDAAGLPTTLAIAEAADLGATAFGTFAVDDTTVLLKYTYVGDANLDGQVDALDYERVDLAIGNSGVSGVAQGDLNYDGVVDALDYEQIDLNIGNGVGASLASATGAIFIPEPASIALLAIGAGLIGRRRRHN
jgi:hypothetical protein